MVSPIPTQRTTLSRDFAFLEAIMTAVTLIGIDLGKHSFHLHAQDAAGRMVFRKKLTRSQLFAQLANVPSCMVVMEACAGAHWVARQLAALGHTARLISPQFVKPFVQGNKNDFNDAQAICEAASRPSMRLVSPKSEAQQTLSALHRVREGLVRQRTAATNQIHASCSSSASACPKARRSSSGCRLCWPCSLICPYA